MAVKYWIYVDGEVPGQYEPEQLVKLPGFNEKALVCPANGDLSERRWQPAGTLPDIAQILIHMHPSPPETHRPSQAVGPQDLLDQTNLRLFQHISQLMKEFEAHREDRRLIDSLQKNLLHSQEELKAAANKLNEMEKNRQEIQNNLAKAQREAQEKERELAAGGQSLSQIKEENKALSKRIESMNHLLAEKELSLTKSLAALSRAEQELGKMVAPMAMSALIDMEPPKIPEPGNAPKNYPFKLDTTAPSAPALSLPKETLDRVFALLRKLLT